MLSGPTVPEDHPTELRQKAEACRRERLQLFPTGPTAIRCPLPYGDVADVRASRAHTR
jgi:hypothetical protein